MKSPKTFLLLSVIVSVLMLGIAYAAIQNITLTVNGTATVTPDQSNFDVRITSLDRDNWFIFGDTTQVTKSISADGLSATIIATDLRQVGDGFSVKPYVENFSADLQANISYEYSVSGDADYFNVEVVENSQLGYAGFIRPKQGDYPFEHIRVTLKKLPIEKDVSIKLTVTITATPVNPS